MVKAFVGQNMAFALQFLGKDGYGKIVSFWLMLKTMLNYFF
jgi:hypothetical protein